MIDEKYNLLFSPGSTLENISWQWMVTRKTLLSTGAYSLLQYTLILVGVKDKYFKISTGHSTFPTVGKEYQKLQLFLTRLAGKLEALDSG